MDRNEQIYTRYTTPERHYPWRPPAAIRTSFVYRRGDI